MSTPGLTVAIVGLGFGKEFVPIYLSHPDVARVVLVDPDVDRLREVAESFAVHYSYSNVDDALQDPDIDAIHLLTPVHLHADLSVAVLNAGKHCACAVPMATSLADIDRVVAAQETSGRNCMMMETSVYGREYLTVEEMYRCGKIGTLTLYRGFHIQNLDGFPDYWQGYPPMHYLTHALSPALALLETTVSDVHCHGAGRLTPERTAGNFDNPFPSEVGQFRLEGSDALVDITMAFFQTARPYIEGFDLYGDRRGIEWSRDHEGDLMQYDLLPPPGGQRGNEVRSTVLAPRDFSHRLPTELRAFTHRSEVLLPGMSAPMTIDAHHGGSHPYLVHEFVRSIVEDRPPRVGVRQAAQWTAPGICAHASALAEGKKVRVPSYR
jgi:predicted dehydrogenase